MKVNNVKTQEITTLPSADYTQTNISSKKMFNCEYPTEEGLVVEASSEKKEDQNKTYTKTSIDNAGRSVIETFNTENNNLISRKIINHDSTSIVEFFAPGTKIVTKREEYDFENNIAEMTEYYTTAPYKAKTNTKYYSDGNLRQINHHRNDNENTLSKEILLEFDERIEIEFDGFGNPILENTYRNNGSIKSTIKQNETTMTFNLTEYREDGSIYKNGEYRDFWRQREINEEILDRDGHAKSKLFKNEQGDFVSQRFNSDGSIFVEEIMDARKQIKSRTVFNSDGSKYFSVEYNEKGKIIDFQKYKNTDNKKHDKFKEKKLNGKIDTKYDQGYTGICYFASTIKSLQLTTEGTKILDDALDYDTNTGISTVKFTGANKTYTFSKEEIKKAMGRLGTGDPDFTALALAWEQYRTEEHSQVADGGYSSQVLQALIGKESKTNALPMGLGYTQMTDKDFEQFSKILSTKSGIITVMSLPENVDTEMTTKDNKKGLTNNHMCSLIAVNKKHVIIFDPKKGKNIKLSREVFMEKFPVYELLELN